MRALAERLLEKEEVAGEEFEEIMRAKGVRRAAPTFRPVYELLGTGWHPPALVEADRRDRGNASGNGLPVAPPSAPTADGASMSTGFEW